MCTVYVSVAPNTPLWLSSWNNVLFSLYFLAPSGPPLNVTTRTVNSTTIQVTWAPPAPEHQNGIITLYNINVTVSETKSNFILNTSTTSLNVTGLHPHYTYTFAVTAVTIRPGTYSEPQTITTPEDCKFFNSFTVTTFCFNISYSYILYIPSCLWRGSRLCSTEVFSTIRFCWSEKTFLNCKTLTHKLQNLNTWTAKVYTSTNLDNG